MTFGVARWWNNVCAQRDYGGRCNNTELAFRDLCTHHHNSGKSAARRGPASEELEREVAYGFGTAATAFRIGDANSERPL